MLPFFLVGLSLIHLVFLHLEGSTSPLGICSKMDKVSFYPYFVYKDAFGFFSILIGLFSFYVFFLPNYLGHPDNYIDSNLFLTIYHILYENILIDYSVCKHVYFKYRFHVKNQIFNSFCATCCGRT